jgi:hypothetical protein
MRPFLHRKKTAVPGEQTLSYYAHGYSVAFETLAREAIELWPRADYLRLPLFNLCRHSIELALKDAIQVVPLRSAREQIPTGHNLLKLWDQLIECFSEAGFPTDDNWTIYCRKLVKHLHDMDPTGEHFRYPSNNSGVSFKDTQVEYEGLIKAHSHITLYCDAVYSMLCESTP